MIRSIMVIPREQIKDRLDEIASLMPVYEKKYWTLKEAELCTGCSGEELTMIARNRPEVLVDSTNLTFQKEELLEYTY